MTPDELEHTIAALSARLMALESMVVAVAANATIDREHARADYDAAARTILDRYTGFPVGEPVLELIEQAFADLRHTL